MRRRLLASPFAAVCLLLSACSGGERAEAPDTGDGTLAAALTRIAAKAAKGELFVEFGKQSELAELADQDQWKLMNGFGSSSLPLLVSPDGSGPFAIDLVGADYLITVGRRRRRRPWWPAVRTRKRFARLPRSSGIRAIR